MFGFVEVWDKNDNYGMYVVDWEVFLLLKLEVEYLVLEGFTTEDVEKLFTNRNLPFTKVNDNRCYIEYDEHEGVERIHESL